MPIFKDRTIKREAAADDQFLDGMELLENSLQAYGELLAMAVGEGRADDAARLQKKLNTVLEHVTDNWDARITLKVEITGESRVSKEHPVSMKAEPKKLRNS